MKVFISWSGNRSKRVASIFRDWLPSVIQSLEPFVSSEDIEKGSRWNTDIAKELKESTVGIICVTKENLTAPWLNFEAGALSKTLENTCVAPFLFDVKPSELKGSPILQFQTTSFTKEDLSKLLETLNVASGNSLSEQKLSRAFEVWYPDLEKNLNDLRSELVEKSEEGSAIVKPDILEEILEMSRNTQRLLGNTDVKIYESIAQLQGKVEEAISKYTKISNMESRRLSRKRDPMFFDHMYHLLRRQNKGFRDYTPYSLLIILSFYRDDLPWLYEAGRELVKVIQSDEPKALKINAIEKYKEIFEITLNHPIILDLFKLGSADLMILIDLQKTILNDISKELK